LEYLEILSVLQLLTVIFRTAYSTVVAGQLAVVCQSSTMQSLCSVGKGNM